MRGDRWRRIGPLVVALGAILPLPALAAEPTGFAVAEATTLRVGGKELFEAKRRLTAAGPPVVTDDGGHWRQTAAERGMP